LHLSSYEFFSSLQSPLVLAALRGPAQAVPWLQSLAFEFIRVFQQPVKPIGFGGFAWPGSSRALSKQY
jgi:hypothetical protein